MLSLIFCLGPTEAVVAAQLVSVQVASVHYCVSSLIAGAGIGVEVVSHAAMMVLMYN